MFRFAWLVLLLWCSVLLVACGDDDDGAVIEECRPANACSCQPGTTRDLACTCVGGSECVIDGNSIEFDCQGNAACGMACGDGCLINCPGTTSCDVNTGNAAQIVCPGTARCIVTCRGSCTLDIAGAASAMLTCEDPEAECSANGCPMTDCGDGVSTCRMDCPME